MVYCALSPEREGRTMRVVLLVCCLVLVGCSGTSEPARDQAPDIAGKLSALKSACEGRVQSLKRKRIDGRVECEAARGAVADCVGYLSTAIAGGGGDEGKIRERLQEVDKQANAFLAWADEKLQTRQQGPFLPRVGKP